MVLALQEKAPAMKVPHLNKRFTRIVGVFGFCLVAICTFFLLDPSYPRSLRHYAFHNHGQQRAFTSRSHFNPLKFNSNAKTTSELCATFPTHKLATVQPVLKIGHTEKREKIEAQLDSCSACFKPGELLIYSDLEEEIKGHQVHDVLATLPFDYYDVKTNPDMKHYFKQKEMWEDGTLDVDAKGTESINGWVMDKYKFLPMIEQAWRAKPYKDFYFFYETDTYVFWDNVFRFLDAFDPSVPLYMGSPTYGRVDEKNDYRTSFANGGPGFVLSRGAIQALLGRKISDGQFTSAHIIDRWLPVLREDCCGDSVLGWTLYQANVTLQGYWPLFNPHPVAGVPFSDKYWCQPVLTLHKSAPEDMVDLWHWEFEQRQFKRPMLYSDLWNFRQPGSQPVLKEWDNGAWDAWDASPEDHVDSLESCEAYCAAHDDCVQYSWRGRDSKTCVAMRSIRYGQARQPGPMKKSWLDPERLTAAAMNAASNIFNKDKKPLDQWADYQSGWMTERVDSWRQAHQCSAADWVDASLERIF